MTDKLPTEGIAVPARTILPPRTISAEAAAALEAGARAPTPPRPPIEDLGAWRAMQAAGKAMAEPGARAALARAHAKVETKTISGVTVHIGKSPDASAGHRERICLFVHGGALLFGEQWLAMAGAAKYADRLRMTVVSVDHRVPPDYPFPIPAQDCLAVYRGLLATHDPRRLAIMGVSAGGNLALAATLMARDEGLPLPAALALMTPEVDLTESGDLFSTNLGTDTFLKAGLGDCNLLYAGGEALDSPYVSPLFADMAGLPPTFIQSGTRDLFLSNAVRLHRKMRRAGVDAQLHVWEAMPHGGFSLQTDVPEDEEITIEASAFLDSHLA
ncbi:alpha/beta hydrolase [Bradyrhizobium sp. RDM4]|uniref:alpha/beta hydrolase n=1 Tax=Bradyrhizobium sp. RDM4 TaxID=3378765 RepID=UPI0038FC51CA